MSSENNKVQKPCVFCNDPENNEIKYGKIYQHNEIITHYYCLLLSSNMQQRGKDEEGILGFLPVDIQRELNRGKRLKCSFCGKKGATLGCVNRKCKKVFHLPCGLENNTLHQFFDQFKSFCQTHRPIQQIDINVRDSTPECTMCYICYDVVSRKDIYKTLWAPCCKKNAWFHRDCVQQLALSAGYFFKCPLCNNKKEFQTAMQESGIFVPSQDASWELVPNAFHELLYRHNRCDANECKCPLGRDHISTNNPEWELILCRTCGSQGTHVTCGKLKWAKISWDCNDCLSILSKNFNETTRDNNHNAATTTTTIITTIDSDNDVDIDEDDDDDDIDDDDDDDEDDDDSESDISLGHNSPCNLINKINISSINLKPGPRSAKLKQLHKTVKILPELPATIEQLNNILDEQQSSNYFQPNVSTSKNQSSNTVNNSKNSQHCQKKIEKNNEKEKKKEEEEEEEEISILEVKKIEKPLSRVATLTQKTTSSLLNNSENANIIDEISFNSSVNKYPELSIERTKKLGSETTLCQQQLRVDNDNVSSISQPTTAAAGVTATAIPNIDTTTRQIPTSPSVLENNNNNNNRVVEDVIIVESDDENDQLLLTSSPSLRVPVVTVENTLSSLLVNEQVDNQLDQFSTQSKLVTTTESIEINNDVIINSEDSLMNIKITGVTSLPPEVFAQVPDISNNTTNDSIDSTTLNLTQNLISSSSPSPSSSSSSSALFNVNNHFTSSVLTAVPVTSIFNKRKADSPSVLSRLVDKVNDVIDKNNKESMNVSCPKRPRQDLSSTTTIITTTPLTTNTCTTCISSNSLNVATDMITTTKSQQNYFKNYSKSMNSDISTSNQYSNGISLANSAVIKVYNQQYIVPLGETTDDSAPTISIAPEQTIMSLNDISSRLSGQQINSDGDAGSKPAGELTVCPTTTTTTTPSSPPSSSPPPTTTTTTTDIIVNSIPELHSSSTGATSATETSKLSTTPTATTTTTATESALFSSIELLQKLPSLPKISTKSPDDDPGAARTRITIPRTRKYDHTISDQTNDNTRSNRFGLIKHKVSLRDLKFRVCSGNSIEITMDDNYRMNVNLDTAIKSSINGQRLRSGRSGVCLVKPRSSRVRGPKSKRKNHEDCVNYNLTTNNDDTITVVNNSLILSKNDDSASNEEIRDSNNILLSLNSTTTTTTTSIPAASYSASNNNEGNLVNNINYNNQSHQRDTAKENLVPDKLYQQSNNTIDSLAKHDNNNVNIKKSRVEFIRRKLRSSKHLSDIDENFTDTSYNINNNNSNNSNSSNNNNNNNNDDDDDDNIRCHVSIDLTRIKSLIDSKPNLFIKKTRSWDKLVNLNDNELNLKFNNTISERNRSLKRSYSFDNISSSNHYKFITPTTANNTVPTTTTTTTMTNLSDNNSFSSEVMFNSQQSKKIKKRRSFKKSNRVR